MTQTTTGACQCGAVRFSVTGVFDRFFLCHCKRCRKDTGSAHAANLFSRSATLEWLSGEDRITTYQIPDTRHKKAFCADCGSALPRSEAGGAMLIVPAGAVDTPIDIRPTAHICCADRADWDVRLEEVDSLDGLPSLA
jgi:hypothetical protein